MAGVSAGVSKVRLPVAGGGRSAPELAPPRPVDFGVHGLPLLVDAHARAYVYLRMSVTDRCDLACVYCMPPGGEEDHALRPDLLSFEEHARLVGVVARMGIRRVRFTGGEPLVRKDCVELVRAVHAAAPEVELAMTTNGTRLAELAPALRDAGLAGVNVSVDTLDAEKFRRMTRGGDLARVLAGIDRALEVGLEVKLNAVLLRHENLADAGPLVDYAWSRGVTPRFIELMPLGEGAALVQRELVTSEETLRSLDARITGGVGRSAPGRGPARYALAADGSGRRVGVISAMSDEFCGECNRVRITARGDLRGCLASRRALSLRDAMRGGASDIELAWQLCWALSGKGAGHSFLEPTVDEHAHVGMSLIGG